MYCYISSSYNNVYCGVAKRHYIVLYLKFFHFLGKSYISYYVLPTVYYAFKTNPSPISLPLFAMSLASVVLYPLPLAKHPTYIS